MPARTTRATTLGPNEFITAIRKGAFDPAYFLRGPERFLHQECRNAIVAAVPEESRAWCLRQVEFEPGELGRQLQDAGQMPMLGGRSFFLISDPEDFKRAGDEDTEALGKYLEKPSPFSTLIFSAGEPDRRRRFIQLLEKKATVIEMLPLSVRQGAVWAKDFLARAGIEISPEIAIEMATKFESGGDSFRQQSAGGVNLLWMRTELEKLATAAGGKRRLEAADLELLASFREEHEIGKMLKAIAERQTAEALGFVRALMASKVAETLLLWSIGDLFRQALKGAEPFGGWGGRSNPYAPWEIAPIVRRRYSQQELLRAVERVHEADIGIKSAWKDSRVLIEFLVWQITAKT